MSALAKFMLPGIVFLLTVALGFWVSHSGRPYNGILFNVHKLLALGATVAAVVQMVRSLKAAHSTALIVVLLVLAALCVVALFASGALMSMGKLEYTLMRAVHCVAPVVLVVTMALVVYLLRT